MLLGYGRGMSDLVRAASRRACAATRWRRTSALPWPSAPRRSSRSTRPSSCCDRIRSSTSRRKLAIVVSLLAVTLPLALRRRFPLAVACVVIVAFVVGRVARQPRRARPCLVGETTLTRMGLLARALQRRRPRPADAADDMVLAVLCRRAPCARWCARCSSTKAGCSRACRSTRRSTSSTTPPSSPFRCCSASRFARCGTEQRELTARARELQREREENARRAVLDERVRIARELHDVVAHHVSVMGVQAGAARRVMGRQPEKAEEVLSSIEASSRQAVVELHRLLGFLRRRRTSPTSSRRSPISRSCPSWSPRPGREG